MNTKFILLILLTSAVFSTCKKSDLQYESEFERSYKVWLDFQVSSGDSYRYVVSRLTWSGSTWLTAITVKEGRIVQRDFYYSVFDYVRRPAGGWTSAEADEFLEFRGTTSEEFFKKEGFTLLEALQWTETEENLGTKTYSYSPASPLYTLEDIYTRARTEWLKKRSDAETFFETDNNGLISRAGFVPDGCIDNCFFGIYIESIEAIVSSSFASP